METRNGGAMTSTHASASSSERRIARTLLGGLVLLVAAGVLLVVFAWSTGAPPDGNAIAGEQRAPVVAGSYCWSSRLGNRGECAHGPSTSHATALEITRGDEVTFRFDGATPQSARAEIRAVDAPVSGDPGTTLTIPDSDGAVPLLLVPETLTAGVDEPPGLYLVEIHVEFERGDATYGVLVDVREPDA